MKKLAVILTILTAIAGAEMPEEVTLTSGRVLRKVQVVRWEKDRVVLKHAGGAEPIPLAMIKNVTKEDLAQMRAGALVQQTAAAQAKAEAVRKEREREAAETAERKEAAASEAKLEELREAASRQGILMKGQTRDQVRRVLGDHTRINKYDSGREEQVIYQPPGREKHYVYFTDGRVTAWQTQDRR